MSPAVEDEVRNNVKGTIYEKLPVGPGQIRLLTISPKKDGEEDTAQLQCDLKTVHLDGKTPYTALSYTWGHGSDIVEIVVNNKPFKATANLHAALEHFRNNQIPTTLWVDAICINQKHDGEKGEQVQLMQDIFSGAEKTWVWLGIKADESNVAVGLVNELSQVYRSSCKGGHTSPEFADKSQLRSLKPPGFEDKLIALDHLLNRDYWYRVWVVQEIALSKKLTLFCGNCKFSWESLLFTAYFLNIRIDVWIYQSLSHKINSSRGIPGGTQRILSIQSVRHDFQEKLRNKLRDSLLFLLSNHRHTGATNEKDKYIALSGLANKYNEDQVTNSKTARAASTPTCPTCGFEEVKTIDSLYDKSKTVGDVYTLACESLTKEQRRHPPLDFLDCAGPPRKFQMPSWVPDWSVTLGRPTPILYWQLATKQHDALVPINAPRASLLQYSDFAAKKQSKLALLNSQDETHLLNKSTTFSIRKNGLLWARGRKLDSIKGVDIVQRPPTGRSEDQKAVYSVQPKAPEYPIPERPSDVLWKTIVLNRTRTDGLKAPDNWGNIFYNYLTQPPISPTPSFLHQWWAQSKHVKFCGSTLEEIAMKRQSSIPEQIPNSNDALEHFKTAFTNAVGYRKLAPTERGSLGLVPLEAKPGDVVVILADCSAPVLLRWREIEEDYEFIGTCYVHGIMQGEAMIGLDAEERISEEFYIR